MTIMFSGDQDDYDALPSEMKEHMTDAIAHMAGVGPHPGKYRGPKPEGRDPEELTESELAGQYLREHPSTPAQPPAQLPPQEAVTQPPQQKGGRPPAQPHGETPVATGAAAVKPQEPEGNF
jgi:hypothetical protein